MDINVHIPSTQRLDGDKSNCGFVHNSGEADPQRCRTGVARLLGIPLSAKGA